MNALRLGFAPKLPIMRTMREYFKPDAKPDPNYQAVGQRRVLGKDPIEYKNPILDSLEDRLGSLAVAATTVLASSGVFATELSSPLSLGEFETEADIFEARIRVLLLDTQLSPAQTRRLDRITRVVTALSIAARISYHLTDVTVHAQTPEERVWASSQLRSATDAVMELGMKVAGALNQRDASAAREAAGLLVRADAAVQHAAAALPYLTAPGAARLCRAALYTLQVTRDCFGTVAALQLFT
jgi:hypothetical protein